MTEYIEKWPVVNRLIDLENEFQQYKPFHGFEHAMYRKICEVEIAIGKTPDADVAPVRHGRWIDAYPDIEPNPMFMYGICSECGFEQAISKYLKYCPDCGAKMDEPVEDDKR